MLKQDWLMRQIEQAFAALARALGLANVGRVDEAIQEADDAIRALSGMTVRDLLRLDTETLRGMVATDKHRALGDLLRARARFLASTGASAAAQLAQRTADELSPVDPSAKERASRG